ncbi:hypothetical protein [Deinococcus rubellus]|uniref:Uncharacterized protein n=1 Tax=Deinococcus rubellus TaxID=1889240 RepID=A0ABY5YG37_9DEIO|nr:hypothetical protein [Deinococcus rubellus]UWX64040.1 hypothetical protein N0D28_15210 [Deinococcus rubellus]
MGKLMCPSSSDLDGAARTSLIPITKGQGRPLKYLTQAQHRRRGGDPE